MNRNTIIGIYLAAGQSTRMGSNKLQLPLGNMSLGNYALAAALNSRLDYVRVITNDVMADWMDSTFYRDPIKQKWSKMYCPEAHLGQAYSLRCGIRAALALEVRAVMILLADQPLITSEMINELLIRYQMEWANHIPYVASSCDGLARPPVIFDHRMLPELMRLQGDQGARHLIRKEKSGILNDFANPDLFMDVDTVEDYKTLVEKARSWKS